MGHRRKTLLSSSRLAQAELAPIPNWPQIFAQCRIDPAQRPEQLTPADYVSIAKYGANCPF